MKTIVLVLGFTISAGGFVLGGYLIWAILRSDEWRNR